MSCSAISASPPQARVDPLALARTLIRCASVTPADAGAIDALERALTPLGFRCRRLRFEEPGAAPVDNLYARLGSERPNFCFAGHTDVVPPGHVPGWRHDPFAAAIEGGRLFGRGAADMKAAVACFVAAAERFAGRCRGGLPGSVSLLITGDEEGPAVNGTRKVLRWLEEAGETLDACLVGEPTGVDALGDTVKIGRRGSLNAVLTVFGTQGHVAYPQRADNPIPRLIRILAALDDAKLDDGTQHFPPSHLCVTSIDVGNPATNVTPEQARAMLNIRFNDRHTAAGLRRWLEDRCRAAGARFELATECSAEAFLSPPGPLCASVVDAVRTVTGIRPRLSTSGGTSDARFIHAYCPVVELGMPGQTMHKIDEHVAVADLDTLAAIYERVLATFFGQHP
jgi:succinyl-diaminopimelate desuccinylase